MNFQNLVLLARSSRREIGRSVFVFLQEKGTALFANEEGRGKDCLKCSWKKKRLHFCCVDFKEKILES